MNLQTIDIDKLKEELSTIWFHPSTEWSDINKIKDRIDNLVEEGKTSKEVEG